ncbi:hypothetical protein [Streptomyces sp. NPDC059786]|uniref:hypothetical protein n=1 Tax=Streptomyces sp. NPDC059786 TaxID=3346946 RepID=UPI00364CF1EF
MTGRPAPLTEQQLADIRQDIADYRQHAPGFACCSAHPAADAASLLFAEVLRLETVNLSLTGRLAKKDAASGAADRRLEDGSTHTAQSLTDAGESCVQHACLAAREEERLRQEQYTFHAAVEGVLDEVGHMADDERITSEVAVELRQMLRDALGLGSGGSTTS